MANKYSTFIATWHELQRTICNLTCNFPDNLPNTVNKRKPYNMKTKRIKSKFYYTHEWKTQKMEDKN